MTTTTTPTETTGYLRRFDAERVTLPAYQVHEIPASGSPAAAYWLIVRLGARRWVPVAVYGQGGGAGYRSGCWTVDRSGGWGVANTPLHSIRECGEPDAYPSRAAALDAIGV